MLTLKWNNNKMKKVETCSKHDTIMLHDNKLILGLLQ
jgi:hypothetical protein